MIDRVVVIAAWCTLYASLIALAVYQPMLAMYWVAW